MAPKKSGKPPKTFKKKTVRPSYPVKKEEPETVEKAEETPVEKVTLEEIGEESLRETENKESAEAPEEKAPEEITEEVKEETPDETVEMKETAVVEDISDTGEETPQEQTQESAESSDTPQEIAPEVPQNPEAGSFTKEELETGSSGFKHNFLWGLIIVISLLSAIGAGIGIYSMGINRGREMERQAAITPTPEVAETPTPTPVPQESAETYSISVLNGSGISGEAGRVKTLLEGEGLKVETVGNADASDFEETEISVGSNVAKSFTTKLTDILEKNYTVVMGDEASGKDDVVITVGKKKS